ncbi:MAG: response regulator [Nostoc sp.]|uniref:GGDEF domain-containing response regulator n=1 Tax=Nostoc sp. TaxID=1180 RepID=UPI002FFA79DD
MINTDFENNSPAILVVDDERVLRLVLRRAMEKEGYRVTEASNGRDCLDICQQQQPDIVLLDAMMPDLDGFSCCTQMQKLLGDNCPPILMITVLDDQESVDRAFEAGATDYITKPIDWKILTQRVNRLLTSRQAIEELQQKIQRECHLTVQMEAATRGLQRLATVDILTKIANRSYFDEYLQREWNRLQKYELSLSLILCNISVFNSDIQDEYLRQIADTIGKCKRRGADLIARYASEEFAMILPNTQGEAAFDVAEAILSAAKALVTVDATYNSDEFTLSLGLTSIIPNPESSTEQLIQTAEKALEQAKLEGGNRIYQI